MVIPATSYAKSGDVNVAFQVVGDGPFDLVYAPGWISNIELMWEEPSQAHFLNKLAGFSRLIAFDKRGTGLSDRVPPHQMPTLEERMDDIRAVMDAADSRRAAIFGVSESASMCLLFAATHPERTRALVTFGAFAKRLRSADYPWAPALEERLAWVESIERDWGKSGDFGTIAPSLAHDTRQMEWYSAYRRRSASPGAAHALALMNTYVDVRHVLPVIRVPTLILHRTDDLDAKVEEGRYIASRIPGAKFVELPGADHIPWVGDAETVVAEVQEFLTGSRPAPAPDRFLATVLFTDIVEGTRRAAELGDRAWGELLERHHGLVREQLDRWRGTEVDTAGDGFFATFDGPGRAIRCALAVRDRVRGLGLEIRAGLHAGECEVIAGKTGGIAVITAARVRERASPGEVLVSSTVRDLVSGSGITFADRGVSALKGVPGEWRLYAVT
ncbi:MAG TPA: adenylate/guanylate cyclase domain-containing protein [Candidatus Limnocylindria bacterium]|nr:adenylate/guanylate cyclase domain-containing protein [Candidatus Limnocylindria bacterium]